MQGLASQFLMFECLKQSEVQVKKENPDLAFGEVGKRLGELWKEVTPTEKSKFEDMAKKDKVGNCTAVSLSRPTGHGELSWPAVLVETIPV